MSGLPTSLRNRPLWLGVDVGGTWLRAAAVDARGEPARTCRMPAPGPGRPLDVLLGSLLRRWRLRPKAIVVGAKGVWSRGARRAAGRPLRSLAPRVRVVSDVEIALRACRAATAGRGGFGGGAGILVAAGTGSCVYGQDVRGRRRRSGGLGPLLGDEGSAFWIGRQWVRTLSQRRVLALAHHPRVVRAVAALAPAVLALAPRNREARSILAQAQRHLLAQAEDVARRLSLRPPIPVSWHGGLFRHPLFLRAFLKALARTPGRWKPVAPGSPPELAAALWARGDRRG